MRAYLKVEDVLHGVKLLLVSAHLNSRISRLHRLLSSFMVSPPGQVGWGVPPKPMSLLKPSAPYPKSKARV